MNSTPHTALVTGAGRGIGRGCALALARAGRDVVVNDLDQSNEALTVVKEIRALGRQAWLAEGNVFTREGRERVVEAALGAMGRIDVLISNPAWSRRERFLDYDAETFESTISRTLTAGFHLAQWAARHMVERGGGGKIVFISSVHARIPYVHSVAYNAAKAGLNHLARTMAAELLPHRINVNVIEPGWIDTPGERLTFGTDAIDRAGPTMPWGRLGTPDDIGRASAFLCSDDADYITGTTLLVDGGLSLRAAIPAAEPRR
jgi:glucose 1-dehydrogenase